MTNGHFKLDGNCPTVTWADPKSAPEHSAAAAQVNPEEAGEFSIVLFITCLSW